MAEFNVDDFLAGLERDKPQRGASDRIEKILMNVRDNQGTVVFIPFLNKLNNNFYYKVDGVREWKGTTSKLDSGEAWYKIFEKELYGELTDEESRLYDQARDLFDSARNLDEFDYNTLRIRNYTLIYGVLSSHVTSDGEEIEDNVDRPCLFIFPSHDPINALTSAIAQKCQALKGNKSWITHILSPSNTGRKGVVSVTYSKSAKVGYDCSAGFEMNSEFNNVVNPDEVYGEDITKHFDNPVRDLVGWAGDKDKIFNAEVFKELIIDLKAAIREFKSESLAGEAKPSTQEIPEASNSPKISKPEESSPSIADDLPF